MRTRKTQAQRREETRLKLVQGAVALLKKKRYAGFRVADVTTMSGVSRGAQSHYFPMKDDLVIEALEFVFKETLVLSAILSVMSYAAFIMLLKLQFPVWPTFISG